MARIIQAREHDKVNWRQNIITILAMSLVGAFGGILVGGILSAVMQRILDTRSPLITYGVIIVSAILGAIICILYIKSDLSMGNYTLCEKCHSQMTPMTETDTLFAIPAQKDQTYDDPFHYLTQNMIRISSIREIPANQRGGYVCCYTCSKCSHRMVRVADFAPARGACNWKSSYYFDYNQFLQTRMKNDLL